MSLRRSHLPEHLFDVLENEAGAEAWFPGLLEIEALVAGHLARNPNIGFVLGLASPALPRGLIFRAGALVSANGARPMPLEGQTPFELCSCTKPFTTTLFELLARRIPGLGEARLGDFQFPGTPPISRTLRDIPLRAITHFTSGLPGDNFYPPEDVPDHLARPERPYTLSDLFHHAASPRFSPKPLGTEYTYSNFGFALLAELLPLAAGSGGAYPELLRTELLEPLGLRDTVFLDEHAQERLARCFNKEGAVARPGSGGFPAHYGSGGLVSTPGDLLAWLRFNMGLLPGCPFNELLPRLHTQATPIRTPSGLAAASGWFLRDLPTPAGPVPIVLKGGGLDAYMSWMGFVNSSAPGTRPSPAGVFALSNAHCDIREIGQRALLALLEATP